MATSVHCSHAREQLRQLFLVGRTCLLKVWHAANERRMTHPPHPTPLDLIYPDVQTTQSGGNAAHVYAERAYQAGEFAIYALVDLSTREIAYVGKTIQEPRNRLTAHMRDAAQGTSPKGLWVRTRARGGMLAMVVLESLPDDGQGRRSPALARAEQAHALAMVPLGVEMLNRAEVVAQTPPGQAYPMQTLTQLFARHDLTLRLVGWSTEGAGWLQSQRAVGSPFTAGYDYGGHKVCIECTPPDVASGALVRITNHFPVEDFLHCSICERILPQKLAKEIRAGLRIKVGEIARQPHRTTDSLWEFSLIGDVVVKRSDTALRQDVKRSTPPARAGNITERHDRFRNIGVRRNEILRVLDDLGAY
jgi:hypothetical protein